MQRARFDCGDVEFYKAYEREPSAWWKLLGGLVSLVLMETGLLTGLFTIGQALNASSDRVVALIVTLLIVVGTFGIIGYFLSGKRWEFLKHFWRTRLQGVPLRIAQIEGSDRPWTCFVLSSPDDSLELKEGERLVNGLEIEVNTAPWPFRRPGRVLKNNLVIAPFWDVRLEPNHRFAHLRGELRYDTGPKIESFGPIDIQLLLAYANHILVVDEQGALVHERQFGFSFELVRLMRETNERQTCIKELTEEKTALATQVDVLRTEVNELEQTIKEMERERVRWGEQFRALQTNHDVLHTMDTHHVDKLQTLEVRLNGLLDFIQRRSRRLVDTKEGAMVFVDVAQLAVELSRDLEGIASGQSLEILRQAEVKLRAKTEKKPSTLKTQDVQHLSE